jgi:hypothetical protein
MKPPISKEQFVYYMNQIKKHRDIEDKINDVGKEFDFFEFNFGNYESLIVKLLQDIFLDKENDWIGYFMYELEFGKKYEDGTAIYKDGSFIKLGTVEDLYDFLIENMEETIESEDDND